MSEKDEKARELVEWHFEVEPDLVEVCRIISDDEANPAEPIKLLEVNEATLPSDRARFGPTREQRRRQHAPDHATEAAPRLRTSAPAIVSGWCSPT